MANEYVVDTHALIWFLEGNPRLSSNAKSVMDDPASVLYLPMIVLAETGNTRPIDCGNRPIPRWLRHGDTNSYL